MGGLGDCDRHQSYPLNDSAAQKYKKGGTVVLMVTFSLIERANPPASM